MPMTVTIILMSPLFIIKKTHQETFISIIIIFMMSMMMSNPMTDSPMVVTINNMLDSMSTTMILLSMWISTLMLLVSRYIKSPFFPVVTILLLTTLMMAFSTNNMIMFYIWFESSLIPITLIIMLWGNQPERKIASLYIIMYTITASLPLLMMLLKLYKTNYHMNMWMTYYMLPTTINKYMNLMMLSMAFLVKLPLFSLHLWLPKAHVEAPVAGSMMLAAILLKLGSYGLLRINKMIIMGINAFNSLIMATAMVGTIIVNILCLRQTDLKALIAYSSVGHMGLMLIGMLSNSKLGQMSAMIIMLSHGFTSSMMFLLTNVMYNKTNSRNIMMMGGSLMTIPTTSLMWLISISMNMALPPTLNIMGEILILIISLPISKVLTFSLMLASFTTTIYSLHMYSMINHGNRPKLLNPTSQMKSMDFTALISHMWPLILLTTMPMKLMLWL